MALTALTAIPLRAQLLWEQVVDVHGVFALGLGEVGDVPFVAAHNGLYRLANPERWERVAFEHRAVSEVGQVAGRLYVIVRDTLYFSVDEGHSWEVSLRRRVFGLAYGADVVVAHTSDSLWMSPDSGQTWQSALAPPDQIRKAYVTAAGTWLLSTDEGGTWRSQDQGGSWERVHEVISGYATAFLETDGAIFKARPYSQPYGPGANGVYRSSDDGRTWERLSVHAPTWALVEVDGTLIAATSHGLRRSRDGGKTWTGEAWPELSYLIRVGESLVGAAHGPYPGIVISDDGGASWRTIGNGLYAHDVPFVGAGQAGRAFAITDYGAHARIFATDDGGASWYDATPTLYKGSAVFPRQVIEQPSGGVLIVSPGRITRIARGMETELPDVPSRFAWSEAAVATDGTIYALAGDIWRFTGSGWEAQQAPCAHGYCMGFAVGEDGTLLAYDGGTTAWLRRAGISDWEAISSPQSLRTVMIFPNALVGLTGNGTVSRSVDGGQTWDQALEKRVAVIAPDRQGGLLAATAVPTGGGSAQLIRSNDAGATWTEIGTIPPGLTVRSMAVTSTGHVFVSVALNGLYRSGQPVVTAAAPVLAPNGQVLRVYPSLARDVVTIEGVGPFEVFDALGRQIAAGEGDEVRLDVSRYPAGLYFVRRGSQARSFAVLR